MAKKAGKVYDFPDLHELSITGVRVSRSKDFKDDGTYDVVMLHGEHGETHVGKMYRDAGSTTSMAAWYQADVPGHFINHLLGFTQEEAARKIVDRYLEHMANSNPPSKEVVGYHCTTEENAASILKSGFRYMDVSTDFLVEVFLTALDLINYEEQGKEDLLELYTREPDEAAELIQNDWKKYCGHGCTIWITRGKPQPAFGSACLKVKLPRSAKLLVRMLDGEAYWLPDERIPAKRFKRAEV